MDSKDKTNKESFTESKFAESKLIFYIQKSHHLKPAGYRLDRSKSALFLMIKNSSDIRQKFGIRILLT